MPASRLSTEPSTVEPYDVLGWGNEASGLMTHAMLCNEPDTRDDVTNTTLLEIAHMGPPLDALPHEAHAVGNAGLSEKQWMKIKTFVDRQLSASEAARARQRTIGYRQFIIHKSAEPPSPGFSLWRFSCVGFVLRAYSTARINLLSDPRPLKTLAEIKDVYPDQADRLDKESTQNRLGVGPGTGADRDGEEAWPIDLVSYVFHSLARDVSAINGPDSVPYQPKEGDEYFPRLDGESKTGDEEKPESPSGVPSKPVA